MLNVDIRHDFPAIRLNIRFEAPEGITVLLGRSGSGKTSVINAVAGILRPREGKISLGERVLQDSARGAWLPPRERNLGYVFQESRLFPHLSVRDNLLYGARRRGLGIPAEFQELLQLLDIAQLVDRRPAGLSGGERQRVAIGRAMLAQPRMLLMDEPMAALDEARKAELLPYIERLSKGRNVPVLYVTHNIAEAARLADTIVVIDGGQVAASGPAGDILADPEVAPVLGVRAAGAIVQGRVVQVHGDGLTEVAVDGGRLYLPGCDAAPGESIRLRVEAQDVMIALERPVGVSALNILPVTVSAVKSGQGPGSLIQLANGGMRLLARVTKRSEAALGLRVGLPCYAVLKSVSVAREGLHRVGGDRPG
ncbi:Maltose/maltodextrin import ATP-binding protein MalK [Pseudoruegeria aquimaris]|uniref:Maltose/maltodextrin import ATP-binding protein MalK n=1 Tax=Pseudoruegeria aquimaris TaxID=393663 RepID=A0A1Y5TH41_9RHOB|nr:molybdenum ABC transporter ATP-binding protein [Pseudoruegeria aquimaris]SLN61924.1 Maltose/maltodextrin import ATP-binding protein MalK [Pseudoruegeria aquimaris]